ncbi:MAG TPA: alpha-1,2-fucosyltransferase [Rhabdochlamydiaceae bacterium]
MSRFLLLFSTLLSSFAYAEQRPFVVGELQYELGNQMYQIAAVTAAALDNGYDAYFPHLKHQPNQWWGLSDNYKYVFWRVNGDQPPGEVEHIYHEQGANFSIPVKPSMLIKGYYQNEKFFTHRKKEILELFAPSQEMLNYLQQKYPEILAHPCSVGIHVRTYIKDYGHIPRKDEFHAFPGVGYYERAVSLFPEDSLFFICSDRIDWCKTYLLHIAKNIIFIEGNPHTHDFYLLTLCKHNIITNSTFSWWAAYLNPNPNKIVVTPDQWFGRWSHDATAKFLLDDWICVPTDEHSFGE